VSLPCFTLGVASLVAVIPIAAGAAGVQGDDGKIALTYPTKPIRFIVAQLQADAPGLVSRRPVRGNGAQAAGVKSDDGKIALTYPTKPIRFIVAQPPGGQNDLQARAIAQKLSARWEQQVIVDNRAGAGGMIGFQIAARAAPDGYTLAMGSISTLAVIPAMTPMLTYDPLRDFAPVTLVSTSPYIVVVHPEFRAKSLAELVALAKAQPGKLSYASSGNATGIQLAAELFKATAGIDMTHVPYKGGAPATTALIAGEVPVMFNNVITAMPHVRSGRLRALAVTSARRSANVPELPTVAELGYPGYAAESWQGVVTLAGTPKPIVTKLNQEIVAILKLADVNEFLTSQGNEVAASTPERFAAYIRAELAKWGRLIRQAGLHAE
jgi:tripartite-type tricarboxylate transporter receptor subunit TctC